MNRYLRCRFRQLLTITALTGLLGLTGCRTLWPDANTRRHRASSVVKYLYPGNTGVIERETIPVLNLPIHIGVAFVPEDAGTHGSPSWAASAVELLPETEKRELLETVVKSFRPLPFVHSIQVIPTAYLTPGGGFANLDQVKALYGLDVMVLVSFDQVQFTDEGIGSLLYWTLVGAYIIPAEKNSTATLLDAAVYDLTSRRMLFRAPGTSRSRGLATPVNLSQQLREDSIAGFRQAATNLVTQLRQELVGFEQRVKDRPADVRIVRREGYSGASGGAWTLWEVSGVAAVGLWVGFRHRTRHLRGQRPLSPL